MIFSVKRVAEQAKHIKGIVLDVADKALDAAFRLRDKLAGEEEEVLELEAESPKSDSVIGPVKELWEFLAENGVEYATRSVFLRGEIDEDSSLLLISQLRMLDHEDAGGEPIFLFIDCIGGETGAGFAIIDTIREVIHSPVVGVIVGSCSSMAVAVLCACDYRMISSNSTVLVHEGTLGTQGHVSKVQDKLKFMEYDEQCYWNQLQRIMPVEKYEEIKRRAMKEREEVYLTAKQALEYGLVNEVLRPKKKAPIENGQYAWIKIRKAQKPKRKKNAIHNSQEQEENTD